MQSVVRVSTRVEVRYDLLPVLPVLSLTHIWIWTSDHLFNPAVRPPVQSKMRDKNVSSTVVVCSTIRPPIHSLTRGGVAAVVKRRRADDVQTICYCT
jgi:hypothetical protein